MKSYGNHPLLYGATPGGTGSPGPPGADGANGVGLPPGGTTGQVPKKASDADYDIAWADESAGSGGGNLNFRLDINSGVWEAGHAWALYDVTTVAGHLYLRKVAGGDPASLSYTPISRASWVAHADNAYSGLSGPYGPAKAIDSDTATFWDAVGTPQNFWIDFGAVISLARLRWLPRPFPGGDQPTSVEVYSSSDGSSWGSAIATATWASDATEKTLDITVSTRWLKVRVTASSNGNVSCADFNVDSGGVPAPPDDLTNWMALS